ncbi:MAG: sulfatase-like hydrolase/transferase [Polyangiales bacterium]
MIPRGPGAAAGRALLLVAPLAVATVGAKLQKFDKLGGHGLDLARVLAADLLFLALACGMGMAAGRIPRRALRIGALTAFHVLAACATALAVFEHGFFLTTGVVGDGFLLVEALRRSDELRKVVASEISTFRAFSLLAPFVWSALVAVAVPWLAGRPRAMRLVGMSGLGVTVAAALLGLLALAVPPRGLASDLLALRRNYAVGLGSDLWQLATEDADAATIDATDVLDPLELRTRGGTPKAKNVIVVMLESTSAKATGLYPEHTYPTRAQVAPFLTSLAKKGALVDVAYSVVPHTSKAIVSVQCGIYPKLDVRIDEATGGGIPTECLARLLREQGFATGFFQSAEHSYEHRGELISEIGFEHFVGKEQLPHEGFDESSYFGYEDDALVGPFVAWMGAQKRPVFASILTVTSHHPYSVPRGFETTSFVDDPRLNDYLNTVRYTDRFLSKLVGALDAKGLLADTMLVIVGDHGEAFGEHGRFQHDNSVYDETLRVPLVLYGGGIAPGTRIGGLRQHVDIAPTVVEVLGFEPSRPMFGASLLRPDGHDEVYLHCFYRSFCRGLRRGNLKFIDNFARRGPEVYDLAKDPGERANLLPKGSPAAAGGMPTRMDEAKAAMGRITTETNARYAKQSKTRLHAFVTDKRPPIAHPLNVDFGPVRLIGWDVDDPVLRAGDSTYVTLYYYVESKPDDGFLPFVHARAHKLLNLDHVPAGGAYPVRDWTPGKYIRDRFPLRTRPRYPEGKVKLLTGFFHKAEGRVKPDPLLPVKLDRDAVLVGTVTLTQPEVEVASFVSDVEPDRPHPVELRIGDAIELLSASVDRTELKAGIKVKLRFVWRATKPIAKGTRLVLRLDGPSPLRVEYEPLSGDLPFERWKPGQFIVDEGELILPERSKSGAYKLTVEGVVNKRQLVVSGTGLEHSDAAITLAELKVVHL